MKNPEISRSECPKIYFNIDIHFLCHNISIPVWPAWLHDCLVVINDKTVKTSESVKCDRNVYKQCRICKLKAGFVPGPATQAMGVVYGV